MQIGVGSGPVRLSAASTATTSRSRSLKNRAPDREAAIRAVYEQYRQELHHYLIRQFDLDPAEAEDIVQTVFARVAETDVVLTLDNPRAFLYRMVSNTSIDMKRRDKVRANYRTQVVEADEDREIDHADPARHAEAGQQVDRLSQALWRMPEKRRKLLLMSRFDGLSYAEIARRVGLSETVVRKHVFRALEDCQTALNAENSSDVKGNDRG